MSDLHVEARIFCRQRADAPKAYTKPWGGHAIYELKPDWTLGEMICEDKVTFDEMQKKSERSK